MAVASPNPRLRDGDAPPAVARTHPARVLLFAVGTEAVHAAPTPSSQLRSYDKTLLKYGNHVRAQNGLKPYVQSDRLYKMAHAWAAHMAKDENLEHNPNYGYGGPLITKKCPNATIAGENVGSQASSDPKQLFELYE